MPEIRLVKKYPYIKDEDVISIFQEGYIKGFENGRKGAIPIEWLERKGMILAANKYDFSAGVIRIVIKEWEKENADTD
jgi:hypothetical protein